MPQSKGQKPGGTKCPTCGSELAKSPLGDAVMQKVAQQAQMRQKAGHAAMQRGAQQRPQMMQQAQQMPQRPGPRG